MLQMKTGMKFSRTVSGDLNEGTKTEPMRLEKVSLWILRFPPLLRRVA
jgi:hypothetical protein